MRELVYLSTAKLDEFQEEPRRWSRLFGRVTSIGAKAPVGEISVNLDRRISRTTMERLSRAVEFLDQRGGGVRWYQGADVESGDWICFEERMNFGRFYPTDKESFHSLPAPVALFWLAMKSPFRVIDDSRQPLVLHGSPKHMMGVKQELHEGIPYAERAGSEALVVMTLMQEFAAFNEIGDAADPFRGKNVRYLMQGLVERSSLYESGWVAGYARVTSVDPHQGITATPLYVERVPKPQPGEAGSEFE